MEELGCPAKGKLVGGCARRLHRGLARPPAVARSCIVLDEPLGVADAPCLDRRGDAGMVLAHTLGGHPRDNRLADPVMIDLGKIGLACAPGADEAHCSQAQQRVPVAWS